MKFLNARPSPAIVLAVLALVFAMVGSAVAGTDGLSSKITKSKVKKISKKQANKQLKANVSGSHVNTADNATNATNATNAANAANADTVDGQSVIKVFAKFPDGTANFTIGTFDGYTLRASCTAGDVENFQLISSDTQVAMTAQGNGNAGPNFDEEQGGGSTVLELDSDGINDNDRGQVTFSVAKTGGNTVSGNLGYDDPNIFNGENVCAVYGHIILNNG